MYDFGKGSFLYINTMNIYEYDVITMSMMGDSPSPEGFKGWK
jgi:hypothetical protein